MKIATLLLSLILSLGAATIAEAQATAPQNHRCAAVLPAGLVIRVQPDERIVAGRSDGPLLLTVTSDVRLFPSKPAVVPRSSKIFANTVESKEADIFGGKLDILFASTPF